MEVVINVYDTLKRKGSKGDAWSIAWFKQDGKFLYEEICDKIKEHNTNKITLDFTQIELFTATFVEESVGKLFLTHNPASVLQDVKIKGFKNIEERDLMSVCLKNAFDLAQDVKKNNIAKK